MTTYVETLNAFADVAGDQLAALWDRLEGGDITADEFVALATAALVQAAARGVALADLGLSATLTAQQGRAVPPLGLGLPEAAPILLAASVAAVQRKPDATRDDAHVTGRAETLAAAQDAYSEGMRAHEVPAWTRVLNAGACELCQDLAGDVLPGHAEMYHHRGCGCTQRPITERTDQ